MKMITDNEKKILRFLLAYFDSDYSINEIAKKCNLAPNGAYEILKKFEKKGILKAKKIANLKSYKINFDSIEAKKLLELVLMPDYNASKISYRYTDLKPLEKITKLCIIFGSYITKKETLKIPGVLGPQKSRKDVLRESNDIDIIFVIRKEDYKKYSKTLERVKLTMPFKLHDVIQTKEDLIKSIREGKKILVQSILNGAVLWGHDFLIGVIENIAER